MQTDKYAIEFGNNQGIQDEDFYSFVEREFKSAVDTKKDRLAVVQKNREDVWKVQNMTDEADNIVGRTQTYKSPIMASLIERLIGTDWFPTLKAEEEQPDDVYKARNTNRIYSMMEEDGDFFKAYNEAGADLFIAGRCYVKKGYKMMEKNKKLIPSIIGKEHIDYDKVYHTKNNRSWFILDNEYTVDRLIEEFGEGIKEYAVTVGDPFTDTTNTSSNNYIDWTKQDQRFGVMYYWNGVRKQYGIFIGGSALIFKREVKENYPKAWIDQWGKGFVPIDMYDASAVKIDKFHPLSPVDRTIDIWRSYSAMMAATIARAKKSANPREVIGSMDPIESRRAWEQGEINRMNGVDVPHFEKVDVEAGSGLVVKTLDVGVNNSNVMSWRDAFLEEIMMSETINLRSAYAGERTLGQDQLRREAEISRIGDMIKVNEYSFKRTFETDMMMLVGVHSAFLDKYVGIEDEISQKYDGALADGTVKDVIKEVKELPFNIKVSINNNNQARKEIEILQLTNSLQTLSSVAPGSKGVMELGYTLAKLQNPGLKSSLNDFAPQEQPGMEAPGVGGALQGAGVQNPSVPV